MVDTEALEKIITDSGKTKTHLAAKAGITIQALRLKMINKFEFKPSEIDALCDELSITRLSDKEKIFNKKVDK